MAYQLLDMKENNEGVREEGLASLNKAQVKSSDRRVLIPFFLFFLV